MSGAVLVTGGAGYVGSFAVRALLAAGERVAVLDDLSTGFRDSVPQGVPLAVIDLKDRAATYAAIRALANPGTATPRIDTILHFAASAYVGESVTNPRRYWENNVVATANLLGAAMDHGIDQVVFSSTCAVYGEPGVPQLSEDLPRAPVNPYGRTKATIEHMLEDYGAASDLRSFRLRYFNAAGADEHAAAGERHEPETHLLPLAIRAALTGKPLKVFGTDWDTPDGTCVRDYVHVEDLADAHVAAVAALRRGHPGAALNLGTGVGASVREVIAAVAAASGRDVPFVAAPRRAGDPAFLVAAPGAAASELSFSPRRSSLAQIAASAWAWHSR